MSTPIETNTTPCRSDNFANHEAVLWGDDKDATSQENMTLSDLQEIMNASIQFQSTHNLPLGESLGSMTPRLSLYPSLASVEQSEENIDVDERWEATSRSSIHRLYHGETLTRLTDESNWSRGQLPTVASIPISPSVASASRLVPIMKDSDDDLIAEKMAAYSGGSTGNSIRHSIPRRSATSTNYAASRARYSSWTHNGTMVQPPEQYTKATPVTFDERQADVSSNTIRAEYVVETADATVLESGSMEGAIAEPWVAAAATETTAFPDDESGNKKGELDSKPPARNSASCFDCGYETQAEATVIGYDAHPAEFSADAVCAEYVGQEEISSHHVPTHNSSELIAAEASEVTDSSTSGTYQINGEEAQEENITEVDVIESGPMEKATAEAWSASTSGEAQVMEDTASHHTSPFDHKVPADANTDEFWRVDSRPDARSFAMMDGEAEVVGITEELHPAELIEDTTAHAELVGADFNTAIAVPSNGQDHYDMSNNSSGAIEHADVVIEAGYEDSTIIHPPSQSLPQEAQATLVSDQETVTFLHHGSTFAPVAAVMEPFSDAGRSVSDPLPATPVTVLPVHSAPSLPPMVSFGDNAKPQPYSGRISSAPLPRAQIHNDSPHMHRSLHLPENHQDEWERAPSFGGIGSDNRPSPMRPPSAAGNLEPVPPPVPFSNPMTEESTSSQSRTRSNASSTFDSSVQSLHLISSNIARGANNVMETLFGNGLPGCRRPHCIPGVNLSNMSGCVLPRTLLPSSVIYSAATQSWVATVNTNQKALEANNVEESSKALRAFSVPTQKQAIALARAWAPPKMHPFGSNPNCFICEAQFVVFRRACHCRNCGVCICGACAVQWPAKMLPVTYNIKKESLVNICKTCDYLCSEFRLALLGGDRDKAMALYSTGNINLTTPFANVKGELFYPVHCAVIGGNLELLKWLVDEHCCPLRSIRISDGKVHGAGGSYTPILTSKGRSLLGIALGNRNIGIVRYLVVEKRMLLSAEKGLDITTLVQNLDLVLRVLPEDVLVEQGLGASERTSTRSNVGLLESTMESSEHDNLEVSAMTIAAALEDETTGNECILCCDKEINCVFTPCGHQICCLECGNHISRCPVCAVECTPMRVFKP